MEKAFDTAVLVERLKTQGIPVAEDMAEKLAEIVLGWTEESVNIHTSPYVKFAGPVIGMIKPLLMKEIDKLDGVVGQ